jgi:hypothetical protein
MLRIFSRIFHLGLSWGHIIPVSGNDISLHAGFVEIGLAEISRRSFRIVKQDLKDMLASEAAKMEGLSIHDKL